MNDSAYFLWTIMSQGSLQGVRRRGSESTQGSSCLKQIDTSLLCFAFAGGRS